MSKFLFKTSEEYVKVLQQADESYYQDEKPKMSDKKYDDIKSEFQLRYPDHSYNESVGSHVKSSLFSKVKHQIKMGSQEKINTTEDLSSWVKSLNTKVKDFSFLASEKLDGLSLSLEYDLGNLVLGSTRGDGIVGDNVTQNICKLPSILKKIKETRKVILRGEVVIFISQFNENFLDKANPRNAAAGSLRRLDGNRCELLSFLAYDIIVDGVKFKSDLEKFEMIKELGFQTPAYFLIKNEQEINDLWTEYVSSKRLLLDYEIDGLVLSINQIDLQEELGVINNRPRYSRAYKFPAQRDQSIVRKVVWAAGRTGKITPVAEIDPVELAGVTITNVTLHNLAEIIRLNVKIGSVVEVKRAGDVIPKIESVLDNSEATDIVVPSLCPSCHEKSTITDTFLMCYNKDCAAKHYETLLFWVKSLDVRGFGDKLVENLIGTGLVKEPADFYKVSPEELSELERMGAKSAAKALKELHSKKEIPLPKFIQGLGIPAFSEKRAELLMETFPSLDLMLSASVEEMVKIKGFEEKTANSILEGLKNKSEVIKNLLNYVSIKLPEKPTGNLLEGISFCFTKVRDKELEEKIKENSGKVSSGVSNNLTYLVTKDPSESSSKLDKARDLGVKIITVEEAWEIVNAK